ncbi:MAG: hypothetical protein H7222_13485 [Methylotenera sp.]|nr:hypothetical protein [Oligoflexia bacterium]
MASALVVSGCSLSPHEEGKSHLYFSIDATGHSDSQASVSHLGQNSPIFTLMQVGLSSPQPVPSGYADCYAVNVVGSGISDSNGKGEDVYRLPAMLNGASCGYAGILSKPVLRGTSAEIDLQIPSGPKRLIQMVGIFDNGTGICARGLGDQGSDNAGIFELGRATVDLFSDQSVEIQNQFPNPLAPNYASALGARRINCHDGSGGGGAAAKFAWLPLPNPFDATQPH